MSESEQKPHDIPPVLGYEMPSTYQERRRQRRELPLGVQVLVFAGIGTYYSILSDPTWIEGLVIATFIWILSAFVWVGVNSGAGPELNRETPPRWQAIYWFLLCLSLFATFKLDRCSHGTHVAIGPLQHVIGPGCANQRHYKSLPELLYRDIRER